MPADATELPGTGRRRLRVLCVDDDRLQAILFEEACRVAGDIDTTVAASGAEALELAATWGPDVLVIDLHLPDTDGLQLLPALRRTLPAPVVRAWLCTADDAPELEGRARAAGFDGCLAKPVAPGPLRWALRAGE